MAQYTSKPFINGYSSKTNIGKVANSAAIIATANGSGEGEFCLLMIQLIVANGKEQAGCF